MEEIKETPWGPIPQHWAIRTVAEQAVTVTDYVANGSFASLAENVKYKSEEDEAVLIRLVDYNNGFNGDFVFIDQHAYEFLGKSKLFGGEIIISNVGANVGTVFKCPKLKYKMSLAPNAIMVKFKGDNDFFYYWLKSNLGQHLLQSIVTGSAQPKFNKTNFKELLLPVPPIEEQSKIARVLRSIDDKIELNTRINHNLLSIAQSLFNERIAELSSFGDGYKKGSLVDIAEYLNGIAMQKYPASVSEVGFPVLKIKELAQGVCDNSSDRCSSSIPAQYVVKDGDIIFSWSGTLLVDYWCGGVCGLNQHLFKVSSHRYPGWFVYFWTKYHLERFQRIAKDKAVTMGHIRRSDLEQAKVMIPAGDSMRSIDAEISPLMDEYVKRRVENRKLQEVRDGILPKLISGAFNRIC